MDQTFDVYFDGSRAMYLLLEQQVCSPCCSTVSMCRCGVSLCLGKCMRTLERFEGVRQCLLTSHRHMRAHQFGLLGCEKVPIHPESLLSGNCTAAVRTYGGIPLECARI